MPEARGFEWSYTDQIRSRGERSQLCSGLHAMQFRRQTVHDRSNTDIAIICVQQSNADDNIARAWAKQHTSLRRGNAVV